MQLNYSYAEQAQRGVSCGSRCMVGSFLGERPFKKVTKGLKKSGTERGGVRAKA